MGVLGLLGYIASWCWYQYQRATNCLIWVWCHVNMTKFFRCSVL